MRERATKHFNRILVAYETLTNPHKRLVYDKLGMEGLEDRAWQLGVRSMSPRQFKLWLEEHMRKQSTEELEELVVSRGKVVATFDISGIWFSQVMVRQQPDGTYVAEEMQPPVGAMTQYFVDHSFQVPLHSLAEALESPLPSSIKELWQHKERPPAKRREANGPKPTLTFDCSLGGAPVQGKKKGMERHFPQSVLASTAFSATLVHAFPNLPPDSPRSIASLLAGNQIAVATTVLPTPTVTTQVTRGFGQNAVSSRATFIGLPTWERAPIVECNFTRRLAIRHSVFLGVNSGGTTWLAHFRELFSLPQLGKVRNGFASMGYTYHPVGSNEAEAESPEGGDDSYSATSPRTSRSQRTESYTVAVTAGLMASGMNARFSWGRTFFVCTPLTTAHSQTNKKRRNVGVRLGVEATAHITGASSWTVKASRKLFENTTVGLNATLGGSSGKGGVIIGFSWTRLGQRFSIPVILAPIPDTRVMLYATAIPFAAYVAAEFFWLRRREEKLRDRESARMRKALHSKTLRRRRMAEEATEVMRASVERKMQAEKQAGGLVVLQATYGTRDGKFSADVTIAVAALVDQGQLVLPRGVEKSRIIGFYDPAPGSEKVLMVRYLFGGLLHETSVKGQQGLIAPLRSHRVDGLGKA
jgi:DnaJ family protein C protein 11